jgi:hypothetical protein
MNPGSTGTILANGQLTSQAPGFAFNPIGYTPYAAQGAARPSSLPPMMGGPGVAGTGYGAASDNDSLVANATAAPFSTLSPVIPAILFLVVGLLLLHFVHFRSVEG